MSAVTWIAAGVLGGGGALARFLVDGLVTARLGRTFPFGTFVVNVSGAAILGFVAGTALHGDAQVLLATATIGSYTTFSTWMLESHRLSEDGELGKLAANVLVSIVAGVGAVAIARLIAGGG